MSPWLLNIFNNGSVRDMKARVGNFECNEGEVKDREPFYVPGNFADDTVSRK